MGEELSRLGLSAYLGNSSREMEGRVQMMAATQLPRDSSPCETISLRVRMALVREVGGVANVNMRMPIAAAFVCLH